MLKTRFLNLEKVFFCLTLFDSVGTCFFRPSCQTAFDSEKMVKGAFPSNGGGFMGLFDVFDTFDSILCPRKK